MALDAATNTNAIHIMLPVIYVPGHWHPLWLCPLADTSSIKQKTNRSGL